MRKDTRSAAKGQLSTHFVFNKTKTKPQSQPAVMPTSPQKRKRSANEHTDAPLPVSVEKTKLSPTIPAEHTSTPTAPAPKPPGSKSTLVPRGTRKKATMGIKDESLLRMVCDCSTTSKVTELHFRKIPHSLIDWNNAHHINKINAWRNQIYGRAGLKARSVSLWYEAEELWFELYFHLSIVESRKRGILLPASRQVREAFNQTFVGSVIRDRNGEDLPPRVEREGNAFASKFNRMFPLLRARLNGCVLGRSGDVFVPKITFEMMERYREMKREMVEMDVEVESEYADGLEEWQWFLSHLLDGEDFEMNDFVKEEVDDAEEMEAKEYDAVAALVRLANSPVETQIALSPTCAGKSPSLRSSGHPD
jgi:hypothetical protein